MSFRRTGQPDAAEDLVQKAFFKVHVGRLHYQAIGSFRGWIFVLARNCAASVKGAAGSADRIRSKNSSMIACARDAPGQGTRDVGIIVAEALAVLPATQRAVDRAQSLSMG